MILQSRIDPRVVTVIDTGPGERFRDLQITGQGLHKVKTNTRVDKEIGKDVDRGVGGTVSGVDQSIDTTVSTTTVVNSIDRISGGGDALDDDHISKVDDEITKVKIDDGG